MKACKVIPTLIFTFASAQLSNAQTYSLPLPPASEAERLFGLESSVGSTHEDAPRLAALRYLRLAESFCGADDFQNVELYDGTLGVSVDFVATHESSTGQIQWRSDLGVRYGDGAGNVIGQRWCTGTLITADLFLTAGHCFDPQDDPYGWKTPARLVNGAKTLIPAEEIATEMVVNFGYQISADTQNIREPNVYPIEQLVEYRIDGLDYAILQLGQGSNKTLPGDAHGMRATNIDGFETGDTLTVIQHPKGLPKKIEAGTDTNIDGSFITYGDIDTLGGSSGSGVLNSSGEIVAVHTNGGCMNQSGENVALSLKRIASASAYFK